jgi:hypothetical protein
VSANRESGDASLQQIKDDSGLLKQTGAETKKPWNFSVPGLVVFGAAGRN